MEDVSHIYGLWSRLRKTCAPGPEPIPNPSDSSLMSTTHSDHSPTAVRIWTNFQAPSQLGRRWPRVLLGILLVVVALVSLIQVRHQDESDSPSLLGRRSIINAVRNPQDAFRNFVKDGNCSFASFDLHQPFQPLCRDRASLLEAMSSGGRIGFDQPYMPLGCDMKWFTTSEICDILSRFDNIYLAGDSQTRYLTQAFNVLIREDLVNGSLATWRFDLEENPGCDCYHRFYDHGCTWWVALNTQQVLDGDPKSIKCKKDRRPALLEYMPMLQFPLQEGMLNDLAGKFAKDGLPNGRDVLIFEHGLWNQLDVEKTMAWIEQIEEALTTRNPLLLQRDHEPHVIPRLFVTPTAQGANMPGRYLTLQNNIRLQAHGNLLRPWFHQREYDYLSLFNLTAQATIVDGVHAGFKVNLVKAMMVLNWLNTLKPPPPAAPRALIPSEPIDDLKPDSAFAILQRKLAAEARSAETRVSTSAEPSAFTGTSSATIGVSPSKTMLPVAPHPIDSLVAQAETNHKELVDKQVNTVKAAAKAYRERRGRHPPPGFDKWVMFAQEKNSMLVEDFYDPIYDSIEPAWGVAASELRAFSASWYHVISIRQGSPVDRSPLAILSDRLGTWQQSLGRLPTTDLPDVDLAFNPYDEPIMFLPWSTRQESLGRANVSKRADLRDIQGISTIFPNYATAPPLMANYEFEEFDDDMTLWDLARKACPPSSPGEILVYDHDFTKPTNFTVNETSTFLRDGFVSDWAASKSACQDSTIANSHGSFVGPMRWRAIRDTSGDAWTLITKSMLMLGSSRIHDVTFEIPIPCAVCIQAAGGDVPTTPSHDSNEEREWEDKETKFFWRGVASGGINDADNWTRFQRHRFIAMLNASMVSQHLAVGGQDIPEHLPGGEPELPYNFALPSLVGATITGTVSPRNATSSPAQASQVPSQVTQAQNEPSGAPSLLPTASQNSNSLSARTDTTVPDQAEIPMTLSLLPMHSPQFYIKLPGWINRYTDAAFTDLRCWPVRLWFSDSTRPCSYTSPYYSVVPTVDASSNFDHKFLPDIDGTSYSGRFWAFLNSKSLPFKSTIYDEWSDGRITPWYHFVPLTVGLSDLYEVMQWAVGFDPSDYSLEALGIEAWAYASTYFGNAKRQAQQAEKFRGEGVGGTAPSSSEEPRAIAGHDAAAASIAQQGSDWAKRVLRRDDMDIYLYRVVLEVARASADDRNDMGFVDDLR